MLRSRAITRQLPLLRRLSRRRASSARSSPRSAATTPTPIIDRVVGPVTVGWKGSVGDHLAYTVLLALWPWRPASWRHRAHRLPRRRRLGRGPGARPRQRAPHPGAARAPTTGRSWPSSPSPSCSSASSSTSSQLLGLVLLAVIGASRRCGRCGPGPSGPPATTRANLELYHQIVEPLRLPVLSPRADRRHGHRLLAGAAGPAQDQLGRRVRRRRRGVPARRDRVGAPTRNQQQRRSSCCPVRASAWRIIAAGIVGAAEGQPRVRASTSPAPAKSSRRRRATDRWRPKENRMSRRSRPLWSSVLGCVCSSSSWRHHRAAAR